MSKPIYFITFTCESAVCLQIFVIFFRTHKQTSIKGERRHYKLTDILQPTIFADGNNGVISFSR